MKMDMSNTLDSFKDGVKEGTELLHEKTSEFHENYVSKVIPDCGKYGDVAKFVAEMAPGVSEYNAIKDGDWEAFAIAAGIDVAALAIGAVSAGAGYAAVKGSTSVAKAGVRAATREIAESGTKKVVKEVAESGAKKVIKETVEAGTEKVVKEAAEVGTEKVLKEVAEAGTEKLVKETVENGGEKVVKETAESSVEKTAKETTEKLAREVGEKIDKTDFPKYIDEIAEVTKRKIPENQREMLKKALKENDYSKLSVEELNRRKDKFKGSYKERLINQWEEQTGQKWPSYKKDVVNSEGIVVRRKGQPYDAHHIIERQVGGPDEWWNLHPARFPDEHQKEIHAADKLARKIFGE